MGAQPSGLLGAVLQLVKRSGKRFSRLQQLGNGRELADAGKTFVRAFDVRPAHDAVAIVITSYSIHYTKLYEGAAFKSKLADPGLRQAIRDELARPAVFRLFNAEWDKVQVVECARPEHRAYERNNFV